MEFDALGFGVCILSGIACFWLFYKCIDWFEILNILYNNYFKNLIKRRFNMYTALFIISVIMFGYLMYVLVKPEKF